MVAGKYRKETVFYSLPCSVPIFVAGIIMPEPVDLLGYVQREMQLLTTDFKIKRPFCIFWLHMKRLFPLKSREGRQKGCDNTRKAWGVAMLSALKMERENQEPL